MSETLNPTNFMIEPIFYNNYVDIYYLFMIIG